MEDGPNGYNVVKKAHAGTRLPRLEDLARAMTYPADDAWPKMRSFISAAWDHSALHPFKWEPSPFAAESHWRWYKEMYHCAPYIRRLGYSIRMHMDGNTCCTIYPPGSEKPPLKVELDELKAFQNCPPRPKQKDKSYMTHEEMKEMDAWMKLPARHYSIMLHGTAPAQIRRRGLLKCVPRLLGWLRAARIALADPRRPGVLEGLAAERAEALAETAPPHWANKEGEELQRKRKRELVRALHSDARDVAKGARWSHIQEHSERENQVSIFGNPLKKMMRVEALAGDHFVFQVESDVRYKRAAYEVKVLHRDAFDVADEPYARKRAEFEKEFANRWMGAAYEPDASGQESESSSDA